MSTRTGIAIGNEVRKGLLFAWSERLQILIELPMFAVFIIMLGPILGQGDRLASGEAEWSLESRTISIMVVWFVPFMFFYMQVVKTFWRLLGEIQAGTIEQVFLSPLPPWLVVAAGRVLAALTETTLVAAATYGIVSVFVPLRIGWDVAALLPALMVVVSAVGVSLIIAGATLVWKRIQLVNDTLLTVVMLFSASAVPLIQTPHWWQVASHLLPLTDAVGSLYRALFTDTSVLAPWGVGGLVPLVVVSFAYLAAGIVSFGVGERVARRRGTLGSY